MQNNYVLGGCNVFGYGCHPSDFHCPQHWSCHREQKRKLAQHGNGGERRRRKNVMKRSGGKPSEDRGSEKNAGSHFADDAWLANALEDPANHPRHEEHRAKGDNQLIKFHGFRVALRGV